MAACASGARTADGRRLAALRESPPASGRDGRNEGSNDVDVDVLDSDSDGDSDIDRGAWGNEKVASKCTTKDTTRRITMMTTMTTMKTME